MIVNGRNQIFYLKVLTFFELYANIFTLEHVLKNSLAKRAVVWWEYGEDLLRVPPMRLLTVILYQRVKRSGGTVRTYFC